MNLKVFILKFIKFLNDFLTKEQYVFSFSSAVFPASKVITTKTYNHLIYYNRLETFTPLNKS